MGYVYLLMAENGEHFKIGWASKLTPRLRTLEAFTKFDYERSCVVEVPQPKSLERTLHYLI